MEENIWKHILINGKSKQVEVQDPEFKAGALISIKGLRPFEGKDANGKTISPNVDDANNIKRTIYNDFLRKPFKNLLILSGAGSSMDVGGLSMAQLWTKAETKYTPEGFKTIREAVNFNVDRTDLEALLSQIDGYSKFAGDKQITVAGNEIKLSKVKDEIFEIIKTHCSIEKPKTIFPHKLFMEKLLQRKQTSPRVKIFTLNYDLLFEYAATEVNAIIIDGFSFTLPRTFSGRFFDYDIVQREGSKLKEEDNFIQRVCHLHKLHGSLNWTRTDDKKVIIENNPKEPLMVYPREAKYEDS